MEQVQCDRKPQSGQPRPQGEFSTGQC